LAAYGVRVGKVKTGTQGGVDCGEILGSVLLPPIVVGLCHRGIVPLDDYIDVAVGAMIATDATAEKIECGCRSDSSPVGKGCCQLLEVGRDSHFARTRVIGSSFLDLLPFHQWQTDLQRQTLVLKGELPGKRLLRAENAHDPSHHDMLMLRR
jgi:hypothetical protein